MLRLTLKWCNFPKWGQWHLTLSCVCACAELLQSCLTLRDPSPVYGILQAGILQWAAVPFSRGSSQPRDWNLHLLCLLHWHARSLPPAPPWILKVMWIFLITSWDLGIIVNLNIRWKWWLMCKQFIACILKNFDFLVYLKFISVSTLLWLNILLYGFLLQNACADTGKNESGNC